MKKTKYKIIKFGYLVVMIFSMFFLVGCSELEPNEEPGSYLFDIETYKTYVNVDVEISEQGQHIYDGLEVKISIEPKKYATRNSCYFYNCKIKISIEVNDEKEIITVNLGKDGKYDGVKTISLTSPYQYSEKYKIESATGEINIGLYDGAVLNIDNVKYRVESYNKKNYAYRISPYDINDKIIVYNKSLNYSFGTLPLIPDFEASSMSFLALTTGNVEVLVLKGEYTLEDLNMGAFFENLDKYFPRLKILAIEELNNNIGEINEINLPQNDIVIYLNENGSKVTNALKEMRYVHSVKSYDEFDLGKISEEYK